MALANFFDKINLGASQLLKDYDKTAFENKLLSNSIAIYYGDNALESYEGRITLELLIRLLSRLYPNVKIICSSISEDYHIYKEKLKSLAKEINPLINLDEDQVETIVINVGSIKEKYNKTAPVLFIGSDNWKAFHSTIEPQSCGKSINPFGAASASCIACANLFRYIFADELNNPTLDKNLCFSTFSQTIQSVEKEPLLPPEVIIHFTLIGAGAIGNAALWALLKLPNTKGKITLIDKEDVSLSNLQRYILMSQEHVDHSKVEVIKQIFNCNSQLTIQLYSSPWQEVVSNLKVDELQIVATAIDTKIERLLLQSVLPQKILNAWTSPECLGVSRHLDFINDICLSCLYLPTIKEKSESLKIAEALNIGHNEPFIRQYLAKNIPIDDHFITFVNENGGIDLEKLNLYKNHPVSILYSDGICGGRILSVQAKEKVSQDMEVPLAHESAMAGLLLAAEVVIETLHLRPNPIEPLSKLNLMLPLHEYILENEKKSYTGKCLCQDEVFKERYTQKWFN